MHQFQKVSRPYFLAMLFLFFVSALNSQTIQPYYFGVNAWMPDTIGNVNNCQDPPCIKYGKLHYNWQKVEDSRAQVVRFGGIAPDKNMPTNYQYIRMIDSIRANGMEPVIQVPYWNGRYSAQQAAAIVQYVNITKGRNIKFWVIGNEPDLKYSATSAAQVAAYIKPFSTAMKAVDTTIKIIGPETAWFNKTILDGLTQPGGTSDITGKDANGRYYVDIVSFHTYPMGNQSTLPSRSDLISKLTGTSSFESNLAYLTARLATANSYHSRTGSFALKAAVTEANVVYQNNATDNLNGLGANSFIGGQFVAELYGIGLKYGLAFINLWSVIEGNNMESNIGFIDRTTGNKKPLYHHFRLLADNFKGSSINCTDNQTNVKSFGSKNGQQTTVMLMNQDLTVNHNFTIRLNTASVSGTNTLKINADGGIAAEYTGNIPNQSTMLLQFDGAGNLTKQCVYSLSVQAVNNLPPSCTINQSADLVVSSATVNPLSAYSGSALSLTATLTNTGNAGASVVKAGYYLSADAVHDSGDSFLGYATGSSLNAGSAAVLQSTVSLPSNLAAGSYYLIFSADYNNEVAETNENNNLRIVPVNVLQQGGTDLLVQNAAASATRVLAGSVVSLTSTIYNAGSITSPGGKIGYYISSDTLLDSADGFMAYSSPSTLTPQSGAQKTKTVTVYSTMPAGYFYILLQADYAAEITESNESNNLAWVRILITHPASVDLAIQSASVNVQAALPGNTVALAATIVNTGTTAASLSKVGYYLSADSVWSSGDVLLGVASGTSLLPGSSALRQATLSIPPGSSAGSQFLLFRADPNQDEFETNETNNVRPLAFTIQPLLQQYPDLVIQNPSLSAYSVVGGSKINMQCSIHNAGNATAALSKVSYFLSTDTVPDQGDKYLGESKGYQLGAGQSASKNLTVKLPVNQSSGTYYIVFQADKLAEVTESNEQNNIRYAQLSVQSRKESFALGAISLQQEEVSAGTSISLFESVTNTGNVELSAGISYYLSADSVADFSDVLLTGQSFESMEPGATQLIQLRVNIPVSVAGGSYYILALADHGSGSAVTEDRGQSHLASARIWVADLSTGVAAQDTEPGFRAYPNPSTGRITVENVTGSADGSLIQVLDITGKIVFSTRASFLSHREILDLPSSLGSGVYVLKISTGSMVESRQILLQR